MAGRNPDSNVIMGEIIAALKAIDAANGYNYTQDADYVYDWLDEKLDIDDETTVLDVRDERSGQEQEGAHSENILEVHVRILKSGKNSANLRTIIRKTKQDVIQCMYKDFLPDSVARDIDYRGDEPVFDAEEKLMGGSDMVFGVMYKTQRGQI